LADKLRVAAEFGARDAVFAAVVGMTSRRGKQRRDEEAHTLEIRALQELIDRRRAGPSVLLEENVEDFLTAVDR
jgi:hypothetical protein